MSDSTSSNSKSSSKSSDSKSKESTSSDASASSSSSSDKETGKSAKESIGGKADIHYGFFSSVRTPEYRSGWDDIWGKANSKNSGKDSSRSRSNGKSKSGAKPVTAELNIADLPDDVRDSLIEAARKKMRKSRANLDKLDAAGKVDWTISVTVNGGRG